MSMVALGAGACRPACPGRGDFHPAVSGDQRDDGGCPSVGILPYRGAGRSILKPAAWDYAAPVGMAACRMKNGLSPVCRVLALSLRKEVKRREPTE